MKGGIFMNNNCCGNNNNEHTPTPSNNTCCIADILETIIKLQNRSEKFDCFNEGCDKPFLGPTPSTICYNTRPVNFFRCSDGGQWVLPYTLNGTTSVSGVFRAENIDGCCCTCRILAPNPDTTQVDLYPYVPTESFVTINLSCVGALKCLPDTYIGCI